MTNHLGDCVTVEELGAKRNSLIAEINKEFSEKRAKLASSVPPYKKVECIELPIASENLPIYSKTSYVEKGEPSNSITMQVGQPVSI